MTLDEVLAYIHKVDWRGSVPGLSRIDTLLGLLGHPERHVKYVHVTGTNGKGSTCAMLASVLRAAGYKTGLYTSPYIFRFNERMQINGAPIPDDTLCALVEELRPLADRMADPPTEFELVTAIGLTWFAREMCDIVVCEVGMGGEFDATNVIPAPEVAVITNIGLEHVEQLGDTHAKIAGEKAGIIKPGCDTVLYHQRRDVEEVVTDACRHAGSPMTVTDPDSQIYAVNARGSGTLTGRADTLMGQALDLCRRTGGALDLSIYPVVRAWGFTTGDYQVPSDDDLATLTALVDYTRIDYDPASGAVSLPEGMEIDLGSVAKGYAGREAAQLLRQAGVSSALLNLGGNIQTVGSRPDGDPWQIGVKDPSTGQPMMVLSQHGQLAEQVG